MTVSDRHPRRLAYEVLMQVAAGAFSDLALDRALSRSSLDPRDKALTTELVYGVLRLRGRLDYALVQFSSRPLAKIQPEALWLLRIGAYQLLELDRIPAHAAVNTTLELARELKLEQVVGFLNAVLRALVRDRSRLVWPTPENLRIYLQHVCSMPVWLAREIMTLLPNREAQALGEALTQAAPTALRVNCLKTNREEYLRQLAAASCEARPCHYAPEGIIVAKRGPAGLPGDSEGLYQIQDEASMVIAHVLQVEPGQRILDCCAAPGGKTTHIAALAENQVDIVALDKSADRLKLVTQGMDRLGCRGISRCQWDLSQPLNFLPGQSFDRVLVDAPCSGLGVLRRNPEARWNRSAGDLKTLAGTQVQILGNAAAMVRPGGKLLYSVCTFSRAETDAVVDAFLARHAEFELEPLAHQLPPEWAGLCSDRGTLRTYPHRHDGMDAFFAARFLRQS